MSVPVHPTSKVKAWRPPLDVQPWKLGVEFAESDDVLHTEYLKEDIRGHFAGVAPGPLQNQVRVTNQNKRATWDGFNEARYPPGRLVRAKPVRVAREGATKSKGV